MHGLTREKLPLYNIKSPSDTVQLFFSFTSYPIAGVLCNVNTSDIIIGEKTDISGVKYQNRAGEAFHF